MIRRVLLVVALAGCLTLTPTPAEGAQEIGEARTWEARTLYVHDYTPHWPVAAAVKAWNAAGANIQLVRVGSCYHRDPCIRIRGTRTLLPVGTVAQTVFWSAGPVMVSADITINRNYNYATWSYRRGVVTHELGHVLGLTHDTRVRSVMNPAVTCHYATAYDRAVLRGLYG